MRLSGRNVHVAAGCGAATVLCSNSSNIPPISAFAPAGRPPAELFENCALALVSIALDPATVEPRQELALEAEGGDYESLLVNWLSEVLWWLDGKRIAFHSFQVTHIEPAGLRAIARGEPRDPGRHAGRLIVKAVTYHQLRVAQEDGGWVAEVYLDI